MRPDEYIERAIEALAADQVVAVRGYDGGISLLPKDVAALHPNDAVSPERALAYLQRALEKSMARWN